MILTSCKEATAMRHAKIGKVLRIVVLGGVLAGIFAPFVHATTVCYLTQCSDSGGIWGCVTIQVPCRD